MWLGVRRYLRATNKLVSEKWGLIAIDEHDNKQSYISISECSRALGFGILLKIVC